MSGGRRTELASSDDADWLDVFRPPITTIVQPSYEVGTKAAELAAEAHPAPQPAVMRKVLLKPGLRVRT